jgi:hypothetical protein
MTFKGFLVSHPDFETSLSNDKLPHVLFEQQFSSSLNSFPGVERKKESQESETVSDQRKENSRFLFLISRDFPFVSSIFPSSLNANVSIA